MADEKAKEAKPAAEEKPKKAEKVEEAEDKGLSPDAKKKAKKESDKAKKGEERKVKKVDYGPDFKYIVRIANTDLDGAKQTWLALTGIKGVGSRIGTIICDTARVPRNERIGKLSDAQIESLTKTVDGLSQVLPSWGVNRQFDYETGTDMHLVGTSIDSMFRDDLNRLKKIRSYRGLRHEGGQKVRGQRSRSNGRTGLTVGVMRKTAEAPKAEGEAAAAPAAPRGGGGAKPLGGAKPAAPAAPGAAPPAGGKPAAGGPPAKPAAKPEGGKK